MFRGDMSRVGAARAPLSKIQRDGGVVDCPAQADVGDILDTRRQSDGESRPPLAETMIVKIGAIAIGNRHPR